MIVWLVAGLHGCAWIGGAQHEQALADAWALTLSEGLVLSACGGGEVHLSTSEPLVAGTTLRWRLGGVEGEADVASENVEGAWRATFTVPGEALAGACTEQGCVEALEVEVDVPGTTLVRAVDVRIDPLPALPELRLTSGSTLEQDRYVEEHPSLLVDDTLDFTLSVEYCPVDAEDPELPCRTVAFDGATAPTASLDICDELPGAPTWTLTLLGVHATCPSVPQRAAPILVRFLGADCDGDGLLAGDGAGEDCDDLDAELPVTFYFDGDDDGFGDAPTVTCGSPGPDHVPDGGDCDDGDPDFNPDAEETLCDDIDHDCDGDGDDFVEFFGWGPDLDGDGYGDGLSSSPVLVTACPTIPQATTQGVDCDLDDGSIHPAATEDFSDTVDQDCDACTRFDAFDGALQTPQIVVATQNGAGQDPTIRAFGHGQVSVDLGELDGTTAHLVAAEFTGDGYPDVVHTMDDEATLRVRPGDPWAPLATTSLLVDAAEGFDLVLPAGQVRDLTTLDFDSDGVIDLVALTEEAIHVFLGPLSSIGGSREAPLPGATDLRVGQIGGEPAVLAFGGNVNARLVTLTDGGDPMVVTRDTTATATDAVFTPDGELIVARESQAVVRFANPFSTGGATTISNTSGRRLAFRPGTAGATPPGHVLAVFDGVTTGDVIVIQEDAGVWNASPIPIDGTPSAVAWGDFDGDTHLDLAVGTSEITAGIPASNLVIFDIFDTVDTPVQVPLVDPLPVAHAVAIDLGGTSADELLLMSDTPATNGWGTWVYEFGGQAVLERDEYPNEVALHAPVPLGVPGSTTWEPACEP